MFLVGPFSQQFNTRGFPNTCHLHLGQERECFARQKWICFPGMHWLLFLQDTTSTCQHTHPELQIGRDLEKKANLRINFAWLEMATAIPGNLTALIKKKKAHNSCMGVFCWPSCPSLLPFPFPNLHSRNSTNYLSIKYPTENTSCLLKDFLRLQSLKYLSKSRVKVVSKHW